MLQVLARHGLAGDTDVADAPAVLLEGSWPGGPARPGRCSLDDALDVRHAWIDEEAARLADEAARRSRDSGAEPFRPRPTPAWIDALALRYALVKWLRVLAFFTHVRPVQRGDEIALTAARGRDDDYAGLLDQVCRQAGATLRVRWTDALPPSVPCAANPSWRRWLGGLAGALGPGLALGASRPRVVLCGNPRVLDPVCAELVRRGAAVWWLYDRFALRSWLRWRCRRVGQLVCNASLGTENGLRDTTPDTLGFRGFDLGPAVRQWIAGRLAALGPRYARLVEQVRRHFARLRPTALVLDEDATPLARIAVAAARARGAKSWVVQHGAPCVRFGFAPLAADAICVWGESSARQMLRWRVPTERIRRTGSPWHDALNQAIQAGRHAPARHNRRRTAGSPPTHACGPSAANGPWEILLLTTVPPRDDRPDPVSFHLTRASYAAMVRMAVAAVARLPGVRLTVKLHPRSVNDPMVDAALAEFPEVRCRVLRRGPLAMYLASCDCVLSCVSSAGIDAMLAGVPVIHLLPQGSGDVLPDSEWGFAGSARTEPELDALLAIVFDPAHRRAAGPDPRVFEPSDRPAAARIAAAVLGEGASTCPEPWVVFEGKPQAGEAPGFGAPAGSAPREKILSPAVRGGCR